MDEQEPESPFHWAWDVVRGLAVPLLIGAAVIAPFVLIPLGILALIGWWAE